MGILSTIRDVSYAVDTSPLSSSRLSKSILHSLCDWDSQHRLEPKTISLGGFSWVVEPAIPDFVFSIFRHGSLLTISRAVEEVAARFQLLSRGWSDRDVWSLDAVMCSRLAAQLSYLADNAHGWPGNDEFPQYEDWTSALRENANALQRVNSSAQTLAAADKWHQLRVTFADPNHALVLQAWEEYMQWERADDLAVTNALLWVAHHHAGLWD